MKISILVPDLTGGGAEKVAVNLANYYASSGYAVDLVLFRHKGSYIDLVNQNVKIINLNITRNRYFFIKLRRYLNENKNSYILSVKRDINIMLGICSIGIDLHSMVFREASTYDKIKAMPKIKQFILTKVIRFAYSKANKIIANSYDTKKDILEFNISDEKKTIVIDNPVLPINYIELSNKRIQNKWLNHKDIDVILGVGRLHLLKDFSFLIDVFIEVYKKNNNTRLIIVGEGKEKEVLMQKIKDFQMNEFIEILPFQENIYPYYKNASIFAHTSRWEGFGNVLVEALSVNTPVVCTNCPGGPKMILENGKYGRLVDLDDKQNYIKAVLDTLDEPNNPQFSEYIKKYSVNEIAKKYFSVMESI